MSMRSKLMLALVPILFVSIGSIAAHGSPCALSSFFISNAWADSCTGWMRQNNGCDWRTCVDNNGRQYCQEACRGRVNRVSCR